MTKHDLREQVFKIIFSLDVQKETMPDADIDEIVDNYIKNSCDYELTKKEESTIHEKASDIGSRLRELDSEIDAVAKGWKTDRMGKTELNILRLAVYEIKYDDSIPVKVAINEAVELAKDYCSEGAPAFINGLLAHFANQ